MRFKCFEAGRVVSATAGLTLATLLTACGGSSTKPDELPTTTTLPPCTQATVFQGQGTFGARVVDVETFTTATNGRVDVTVDWTFASSPIGVYVVPTNSCTLETFNARTCNFLVRSESGAKPRKVSATLNPGTYDLLLANGADQQESLSALVVVSSASCPPLAVARAASGGEHVTVAAQARGLVHP